MAYFPQHEGSAMSLTNLFVEKYRSLRRIELPLQQLNVVTGPNGSGKSNLYRALWLLAQIGEGGFARAICQEGGLPSVMWAGPLLTLKKPQRLVLGFQTTEMSFQISCGYPPPNPSHFSLDPQIKEESVWFGPRKKPSSVMLDRSIGSTTIRDIEGNTHDYPIMLDPNESVLAQLREPHRFPELLILRERIRSWRFYHHFHSDQDSPMRRPQIAVRTPLLSHDGTDLASALATILEVGDRVMLQSTIEAALPGRSLEILSHSNGSSRELSVGLTTTGCTRPLAAHELSDGTLKFLCLAAALLSPRPPSLIALNEPESSLHPDLLAPLAELIICASQESQIWVSTHSVLLTQIIAEKSGVKPIQLELQNGETIIQE